MRLFAALAHKDVFVKRDESGPEHTLFALRACQGLLDERFEEAKRFIKGTRLTEYETQVRHLKSNSLIII